MSRTKVGVTAPVLGRGKRPLHVNVTSSTTCAELLRKVLEKLRCKDPPFRYQLWAVADEKGEFRRLRRIILYEEIDYEQKNRL